MSRRLTNGDTCSRHILTHSDALRGWRRWQRDCKGKGELRHVRKLGKENAPESPPYIIRPGLRSPPARLRLLLCCSSSRTLFHLTFSDTRYIQILLLQHHIPDQRCISPCSWAHSALLPSRRRRRPTPRRCRRALLCLWHLFRPAWPNVCASFSCFYASADRP